MNVDRIRLDKQQLEVKKQLDIIALSINNCAGKWHKIKNLIFSKKRLNNIYLHGKVGRGKTLLMSDFYDQIKVDKKIIHFQKFMQELHSKMHRLKAHFSNQIIKQLAHEISQEVKLLCIDEFEIKDITDAMMIMNLFQYLQNNGTIIFVTTNTPPNNLYKDGLQRGSFLPFITNIMQNFNVINLDNDIDYRYQAIQNQQRVFAPIDKTTIQNLKQIKEILTEDKNISTVSSEIFGRKIIFKRGTNNAIFTNFEELFEQNLGYSDYTQLTKDFDIFIVEQIRPINTDETDLITRFINFIDSAYYNKVLLFLTSECELDQIYKSGRMLTEFQRTKSRIYEMNTEQYSPRIEHKIKIKK